MRITLHCSMLRKSQGPPSTVFDGALLQSIDLSYICLYGSMHADKTPCFTRRAVSEYLKPGRLPCYKGRPFTGYCPGIPSLRHGEVRSKCFHRVGQGAPGAKSNSHCLIPPSQLALCMKRQDLNNEMCEIDVSVASI